ncbi:unnamed protein product [Peronospora belbahrii]|uniref:Uncharacterized protein n=1 Tax=Peronospora belbahrii TaxID=622444 RepID=A0AAU9KUJ8_9STRA|nr:unnamed protein product [Peronospora belbahrii]
MKFTPGLVFAALAVTAANADTPNTYLRSSGGDAESNLDSSKTNSLDDEEDDDNLEIDLNELFGDTKNIGENGKINILDLIGSRDGQIRLEELLEALDDKIGGVDSNGNNKYLNPHQVRDVASKDDDSYNDLFSLSGSLDDMFKEFLNPKSLKSTPVENDFKSVDGTPTKTGSVMKHPKAVPPTDDGSDDWLWLLGSSAYDTGSTLKGDTADKGKLTDDVGYSALKGKGDGPMVQDDGYTDTKATKAYATAPVAKGNGYNLLADDDDANNGYGKDTLSNDSSASKDDADDDDDDDDDADEVGAKTKGKYPLTKESGYGDVFATKGNSEDLLLNDAGYTDTEPTKAPSVAKSKGYTLLDDDDDANNGYGKDTVSNDSSASKDDADDDDDDDDEVGAKTNGKYLLAKESGYGDVFATKGNSEDLSLNDAEYTDTEATKAASVAKGKGYTLLDDDDDANNGYGKDTVSNDSSASKDDADDDDDDDDDVGAKADDKYPLTKGNAAYKVYSTVDHNEEEVDDVYSSKNLKGSKNKDASPPNVGHLYEDNGVGVVGVSEDVVKDSKGKSMMVENDPTQNDHRLT